MKIAIEGCAHGELDKIYETLQTLENKNNIKIDLLIICGDFQAVRNSTDLECMAVPPKFRKLNTFYKYYSGEKKAPVLTIFIGGNHEASNYLSELSYGGWVCPNIFYMGYANVINVGGLRIAGLSGIYKGTDYLKGHFESPPYDRSTVRSVYHVRNIDVFRLKQIKMPIDICISHDWPKGVYKYGNMEQLFRFKPFFREEMESNKLGSQPAEELLNKLKPTYWFSAHLHCKFSAVVPHDDKNKSSTKFLALDKCLPKRRFLQILEIGEKVDSVNIEYDPEWLCILHNTNHLLNLSRSNTYMPGIGGNERYDFSTTEEEIKHIRKKFNNNMKVPENFTLTAPKHEPSRQCHKNIVQSYSNPQTQAFCKLISIRDPNENAVSSYNGELSPDEISGKEEDESEYSLSKEQVVESPDFFIDRQGTPQSRNTQNFLKNQFCSTPLADNSAKYKSFPDIKEENILGFIDSGSESNPKPIMFKRRNIALYTDNDSSLSEHPNSMENMSIDSGSDNNPKPIVFKRRNIALYTDNDSSIENELKKQKS